MSDPIRTYQDLIAWQRAFQLGKQVYRIAGEFPELERFGLIASVRGLAYSIASHIAQGYGRGNSQDYVYFLKQARGKLYQLDTQLMFARDFQYLKDESYESAKGSLDECERVLAGLIRSLGGWGLDASMPLP